MRPRVIPDRSPSRMADIAACQFSCREGDLSLLRLCLLSVLLSSVLLLPQAIFAHADLLSSIPAAGESVQNAPGHIELVFSEPVTEGNVILLHEAETYAVAMSVLEDGTILRGQVKDDLEAGIYQVVWTATSQDAHTLSGSYQFEIENSPNPAGMTILIGVLIFGLAVCGAFYLWWRRGQVKVPPQ